MKFFTLTAIYLLIFQVSLAQEDGDRKVIISNSNTEKENYILVGKHLLERGLTISEKDDDFGYIVFDPFKFETTYRRVPTTFYLIITATCKDSLISVSSQFKQAGTRKRDLIYDSKKPEIQKGFALLTEMVSGFGNISYEN